MKNRLIMLLLVAGGLLPAHRVLAEDACIRWEGPLPDSSRSDAGLSELPGVKHYTVFPGSKELGMFNHGPMVCFHNDMLFVTWFSHRRYEDAAGTRALYSYSKDLRFWSEPQVLLDSIGSMADKGELGTGLWPVFEEINGRLYVSATVKKITGWKRNGKAKVPIYEPQERVVRPIADDGTPGPQTYWLAENIPAGYESEGIVPYPEATNKTVRSDLVQMRAARDLYEQQYAAAEPVDKGVRFCEPTYFKRPDGKEVGVYRDLTRTMRLYAAVRNSPEDHWSPALKTNIPDSPSKSVAGELPDGTVYLIGNFLDKLWMRDPLLLAFSDDGISFDRAYVLRSGASQCREKNPGDHKGSGFQYPNACVADGSLWVAYSISKEQIAISSVPIVNGLLMSGGFEVGDQSPSGGWASRVSSGCEAIYVTQGLAGDSVHGASRAVSISNPVGPVERWYVVNSMAPEVTAGEACRFSVWVKAERMGGAQAWTSMAWLDAADQVIGRVDSDIIAEDVDWVRLSIAGTVPDGAVKVRPMLFASGEGVDSDALITFDDFEMVMVLMKGRLK